MWRLDDGDPEPHSSSSPRREPVRPSRGIVRDATQTPACGGRDRGLRPSDGAGTRRPSPRPAGLLRAPAGGPPAPRRSACSSVTAPRSASVRTSAGPRRRSPPSAILTATPSPASMIAAQWSPSAPYLADEVRGPGISRVSERPAPATRYGCACMAAHGGGRVFGECSEALGPREPSEHRGEPDSGTPGTGAPQPSTPICGSTPVARPPRARPRAAADARDAGRCRGRCPACRARDEHPCVLARAVVEDATRTAAAPFLGMHRQVRRAAERGLTVTHRDGGAAGRLARGRAPRCARRT